jgi:hypothetical protein
MTKPVVLIMKNADKIMVTVKYRRGFVRFMSRKNVKQHIFWNELNARH